MTRRLVKDIDPIWSRPDLNDFESRFASALDRTGDRWSRNPSRVGYGIPLITLGPTRNFYPDFLVWKEKNVFAIDTKGGHLIAEAAARKLLRIDAPTISSIKVRVRLVSEGSRSARARRSVRARLALYRTKAVCPDAAGPREHSQKNWSPMCHHVSLGQVLPRARSPGESA